MDAADQGQPPDSVALSTLCGRYWYPLYAFIRRRGYAPADAQDLTQDFFAMLLDKQYLVAADPQRGRFRTFLLTAVNRFLSKEAARQRAQKRGGRHQVLSFDFQTAEGQYQLEPVDHATPERLFERRWALTLLEHVLAQLADDYSRKGKQRVFDVLKSQLMDSDDTSYATLAGQLQMSEGAVKVAVHRLRKRFGDVLKEEIAATVESADEVEDEVGRLLAAVQDTSTK